MPVTADDISIVLSGGSGNLDPTASLGGEPSSTPILDNQINNLFDDVDPSSAESGAEDYRCFYMFNDGEESVYNVEIWIQSEVEGGSTIELGIQDVDEVQRLTVSGTTPTSGNMTLSYEGEEFVVPTFSDLATASAFIQNALNALVDDDGNPLLETVEVTTPSSIGAPTIVFDILFTDRDGKTDHDQIVLASNNYSPTSVVITLTTTQEGAPINTIAPTVPNASTPPSGVNFFVPTEQSPISVFKLAPAEGFPIWVKRVTEEGVDAVEQDGVTVRFKMETIEP